MMDIKDTSGNIRLSTPINEGSMRRFLLMQEDYITLNFSLDTPIYFKLGDYVEDDKFGLFEITDIYKPSYNETTGGYDYELRLNAHYWKWKNKVFKYTPEVGGQEASWNLTSTLDVQLEVFLRNLKALGYNYNGIEYETQIDGTVENSAKLMTYDNTNLLDALTNLAQTWDCEWWVTDSVIHFGKCEFGEPVEFKLGDNVSSMTRSESQTNYATRIYAFGSTRNIPPTYRKKLVFNITDVNGNNISDSSRPLKPDYFPSRNYIYEDGIEIKYQREEINYYTSSPAKYSVNWKISDNLKAGSYNISSEYFYIWARKGAAGYSINILKSSLSLQYESNSVVKTILLQSISGVKDGEFFTANFKDIEFTIKENASNCKLIIDTEVAFTGNDVNVQFRTMCKAILQGKNISANVSVTFVSGVNEGKTFSSIYNPNFLSESNIIKLPDDIYASIGDRYIINNIIKEKVPISYFSNDIDEVVVNGIVQKRLMLPSDTPYIDAYDNMTQEEAVEAIVVFDDIYPKRVGTLESVTSFTKEGDDDSSEDAIFYRYKDSGITFSDEYRIPENDLQITFQSGKMNGMTFGVKFNPDNEPEINKDGSWNPKAQVWEIIRNEDYGRYLPDDIIKPEDGNKYVLFGFNTLFISDSMIPEAEIELKKEADKYIEKSKIDPSTYSCTMMSDQMQENGKEKLFEIGDRVNLVNSAFFDTGSRISRIIGFEYKLYTPFDSPVYTVGETATYSRIGEIESKIDALTYKGQNYTGQGTIGSGSGVYLIRTNDSTPPSDSNAFSAKRSFSEFISKKSDDIALGHIDFSKGITTLDLLVKELANIHQLNVDDVSTLFSIILKDSISSETFIPGFLGEGAKLYKDDAGNWNFECDNMTIRKAFNVFEAIINRVRSVNGAIVISQANGKIIEVIDNDRYWKIKFEGDYQTVQAHDLLRCQVFGKGKYYWVEVDSVEGNYANILKTEFADSLPEVGDEVVQMGNTVNPARQSLIYLSAEEGTATEEAVLGDFEPLPEEPATDNMVQKNYIVGKDGAIIADTITASVTPEGEIDFNNSKFEIQIQSDIYATPVTLCSASAVDGVLNAYVVYYFSNQVYLCDNTVINLITGEHSSDICISYNLTEFIPISNSTLGITDDLESLDTKSFAYDYDSGKYILTLTGTRIGNAPEGMYVNYIIETSDFINFETKDKWYWTSYNQYDKAISVYNSTDLFLYRYSFQENNYQRRLFYRGKEIVYNQDSGGTIYNIYSIYKIESNKFLLITSNFVFTLKITEEELTYNGVLEKLLYELPNDYQASNIGGSFFANDKVYFNDLNGFYNIYDLKTGVISAPQWIDPDSTQHNFQEVLQFKSGVLFHDFQYTPDYWLPISYAQPNGKPKISILDGVNSKSLAGKNKGVLGYIGDITDADFPSDKQPTGYGAYFSNFFGKGVFVLSSGKTVESEIGKVQEQVDTVIEAIPGKVEIEVSKEISKLQIGGRNLLKDSKELNINNSALTYKTFIPTVIIKPSTSYVFSVNKSIQAIDSDPGFTVRIVGINGEGIYNSFDVDISSERQLVKFTTPESMATSVVRIYNAKTSTGKGAELTLYEFKLEEGTIATDWTPAPEDVEGIAKTYTDAQIKIVNDNISSKVSQKDFDALGNIVSEQGTNIEQSQREISLVAKASGNAQTIALAMSQGKMLYRDPTFKEGNNGIGVYNNNSNGTVTISRESISGNPNDSGVGLKIVSQGNGSPGLGGFYFGTSTRANAVFVTRFIANIPLGYKVEWASNATGDGGRNEWLTSQEGTGGWQEYACIVRCGATGTFSSTNFFYITDGGPVTWYLAYASVFDATGVNDFQTKDEIKAGITITPNNVNVFGKDISLQGKVTIGSLDGTVIENGKIKTSLINAHQIVVDGLNAGRITTSSLNVTDGSIIGPFEISSGGYLVADNKVALIGMSYGRNSVSLNSSQLSLSSDAGSTNIRAGEISIVKSGGVGLSVNSSGVNTSGGEFVANFNTYRINGGIFKLNTSLCLNIRQITSSVALYNTDCYIVCNNNSGINLNLPTGAYAGQMIIIKRRNSTVTVYGNIFSNGTTTSQVISQVGRAFLFVYDGSSYWNANYMDS